MGRPDLFIDIVFSLDRDTAVGLVASVDQDHRERVRVGQAWWLRPIATFVDRHPTIKMLALSFLLLIGTNLVAEGLGFHIPKGYTYFAMGFSVAVEMLNLRLRKKSRPVHLHRSV